MPMINFNRSHIKPMILYLHTLNCRKNRCSSNTIQKTTVKKAEKILDAYIPMDTFFDAFHFLDLDY